MTDKSATLSRMLSVAIPVYNFADFLPSTLDSLVDQTAEAAVDVLVFDGGSTDKTPDIVRSYSARHSNLRYVRALRKGGIDADMARCVELVGTTYCWLFSGDDIMRPKAIGEVLSALKRWQPDLLLCRHNECQFDMSILRDWPVLGVKQDRLFDLHDPQDRREYLNAALSSEAFFSFMGGLVVRRRTWLRGRLVPSMEGSNWAHIGRLWSLTGDTFKLGYLNDVVLDRRGGNDSFSKDGMLKRLEIQISGLLGIIEGLYGSESDEARALKRVVRGEVEPHWANAVREDLRRQNAPFKDFERLERMLAQLA